LLLSVPVSCREPHYFLAWTISSQCYNTGKVTIKSGGNVLVEAHKNSRNCNFTMLNQSHADINSNIVQVEVEIKEAVNELKNSKTGGAILDNAGRKVGYVYSVCIEDGADDDYNDIYINLVGWSKKG
jgi:hypothetical protein